MSKFYRVTKKNFLWDIGAILERRDSLGTEGGYQVIDQVFAKHETVADEYISAPIIENSPDYFERVYPVNLVSRTVYKLKEEAKEYLQKEYKGD